MDDLISRQAAIDAIEPTLKSILQGNSFKAINVMDKIRDLPSAQPEIVRCRDCKHRAECEWDTGDPYGLGRNAEDDEWFCADGERRTDDATD